MPTVEQEAIIASDAHRALVIAGPGSGKTAVIAARIGRLIGGGVRAEAILAISFTVKAAGELRQRINSPVTAATFHSLCAAILRGQITGHSPLPADFRVMSDEERDALLEEICKSDAAEGGRIRAAGLGDYIESRKRCLLLPGEERPHAALEAMLPEWGGGCPTAKGRQEALYGLYRRRLKEMGALDFDDLVAGAVRLLAADSSLLESCRKRYQYIFVDEYQDINFAQYALLRLLAPPESGAAGPSLWAIGDPNQAIYGFRGADRRFIDHFPEEGGADTGKAACFQLSRSFRCAAPIVDAASRLTNTPLEGRKAEVSLSRSEYRSAQAEAEGVARIIASLLGGASFFSIDSGVSDGASGDTGPSDCAILLRTLSLAEPFVKALNDHGIPYILQKDESRQIEASGLAVQGVRIMTIHAAKGLEFEQVFVPALEEGILPFTLFSGEGDTEDDRAGARHIDEEKRVLYVAMTRAKTGLSLSWAQKRAFRGRLLEGRKSRFLDRLAEIVPIREETRARKGKEADAQGWLF
jgi:DNA helicase-2/ATP-dependent DNA helicase PcrA